MLDENTPMDVIVDKTTTDYIFAVNGKIIIKDTLGNEALVHTRFLSLRAKNTFYIDNLNYPDVNNEIWFLPYKNMISYMDTFRPSFRIINSNIDKDGVMNHIRSSSKYGILYEKFKEAEKYNIRAKIAGAPLARMFGSKVYVSLLESRSNLVILPNVIDDIVEDDKFFEYNKDIKIKASKKLEQKLSKYIDAYNINVSFDID